ncbi:hypothetical protein PHLGIDRAFT_115958 [Phlebiopsis gigantea 11061_1 CR5-6]|uniref:Translation initiation factor 3 N-terminal domain-containing protein n=1 Tax=Phlebiopsis gigantea (strain 11061_1 CR5-6) TaxID=745531 RepID=A0A0C3S316_PHLG1|nr:hypothetical protein PHLGIDRAFT_115958 [Phlebiopsis gigantea 11061_1 CR5-6]
MLKGATVPVRLLRKCTVLSPSLIPPSRSLGTRFASFTKHHSPPSGRSDSARVAPTKLGPGRNLKTEPIPDAVVTRLASKQQSKSSVPPAKPRDEQIRYKIVRLVDPQTGALGPLTPLANVIEAARNKTTPDSTEGAEAGENKKTKWWRQRRCYVELVAEQPHPIVKIVDIADMYHKNREAAKKKKESTVKEKEIQMTWSVAQGDLEHKLKKAREALNEGERITIGFARKKGQPYPKPEEIKAKLAETAQSFADVAEEWKPTVVLPNHTGFLYFQKKA